MSTMNASTPLLHREDYWKDIEWLRNAAKDFSGRRKLKVRPPILKDELCMIDEGTAVPSTSKHKNGSFISTGNGIEMKNSFDDGRSSTTTNDSFLYFPRTTPASSSVASFISIKINED